MVWCSVDNINHFFPSDGLVCVDIYQSFLPIRWSGVVLIISIISSHQMVWCVLIISIISSHQMVWCVLIYINHFFPSDGLVCVDIYQSFLPIRWSGVVLIYINHFFPSDGLVCVDIYQSFLPIRWSGVC